MSEIEIELGVHYFVFVLTESGSPGHVADTGEIEAGCRRRASQPRNSTAGACGVSTSGELQKEYNDMFILENRSLPVWRWMGFQFCPNAELTTAGSQESVFGVLAVFKVP